MPTFLPCSQSSEWINKQIRQDEEFIIEEFDSQLAIQELIKLQKPSSYFTIHTKTSGRTHICASIRFGINVNFNNFICIGSTANVDKLDEMVKKEMVNAQLDELVKTLLAIPVGEYRTSLPPKFKPQKRNYKFEYILGNFVVVWYTAEHPVESMLFLPFSLKITEMSKNEIINLDEIKRGQYDFVFSQDDKDYITTVENIETV